MLMIDMKKRFHKRKSRESTSAGCFNSYSALGLLILTLATIHLLLVGHNDTFDIESNTNSSTFLNPSKQNELLITSQNFHEITHGECASSGYESIKSDDLCLQGLQSLGYSVHDKLAKSALKDRLNECTVLRSSVKQVWNWNFNQDHKSHGSTVDLGCSPKTPCICKTHPIINTIQNNTRRTETKSNGNYIVKWNLNTGGNDDLLEAPYLRAGFEQGIKDYINNDIRCRSGNSGIEFLGVEIAIDDSVNSDNQSKGSLEKKKKAISGNGRCKGDVINCKKPLRLTPDGPVYAPEEKEEKQAKMKKDEFCDAFLSSTVFDVFSDVLATASAFNYDLDVGTISELDGNLKLKYDVQFQPVENNGLNRIDDLDLIPDNPIEIFPRCFESQCAQKDVLRKIFAHFRLSFDEDKHECSHQGINCDQAYKITQIWIVNHGFPNIDIPTYLASLPDLQGLFLGGNDLIGTIPSELARLTKLQLLWLENNQLTGQIPSQLGNLRGLLEVNLHQNMLKGTIPSFFGKLKNLRMLNLGQNKLFGRIPSFTSVSRLNDEQSNIDCILFPNPFNGILKKIRSHLSFGEGVESLSKLHSLILYGNSLTGSIPSELSMMTNIENVNIAGNVLNGTMPSELGQLGRLQILDFHGNSLSGAIPTEVGKLQSLEILNFFGNKFESTIPSEIGLMTRLNELILDGNQLQGSIPPSVGNLIRLKHLTFGRNNMSGAIPSEIGNLDSLQSLDIRDYVVTANEEGMPGTIPPELGNLKSWKNVVFENNEIGGDIPTMFGNLTAAETLWLENQNFSGTIPAVLTNLAALSLLSIGNNSLTGTIPPTIGTLENLETLNVGSNEVSGSMPSEILSMQHLKYFSIAKNNFTGTIPSKLENLTSMEMMFLGENGLEGPIPTTIGSLKSLQVMDFNKNTLIGSIPTEIGDSENLVRINLNGNVLGGSIPSEIQNLKTLKSINLESNEIEGTIPSELLRLELIELRLQENALGGTIATEMGAIPSLKVLTLGQNDITGQIPSELGNLKSLDTLKLDSNGLTGSIPIELVNIENLTALTLNNNSITGEIPTGLAHLISSSDIFPTGQISHPPTQYPSYKPSKFLSDRPSLVPTQNPSLPPSQIPSILPSLATSDEPSKLPSLNPSQIPSALPSLASSNEPSNHPSLNPSQIPSIPPSVAGSDEPSKLPSLNPSLIPSSQPSEKPTYSPSELPSSYPSQQPSLLPSKIPSSEPTAGTPSSFPSSKPSEAMPSFSPSQKFLPSLIPSQYPSNAPTSVSKIVAFDGNNGASFGHSVAVSGDIVVVGAHTDDENGSNSGSAYILATNGTFIRKILDPDGSDDDQFGFSVDISEDTIVIGSRKDDENGINSGAVHIFASDGTYSRKIMAPDGAPNDQFGASVSVSGGTIVVGAQFDDEDSLSNAGSVYLFSISGVYLKRTEAPNRSMNERFGNSVSISGDAMVIGAVFDEQNGWLSGSAYIYTSDGDFVSKIVAPDGEASDQFGLSVAISGDRVVVGAYANDDNGSNSGSAYIYAKDGTFMKKILAPDGEANDNFGNSVAISNDRIIVGSRGADENGSISGSAYAFSIDGDFIKKVVDSNVEAGDRYGSSVAVSTDAIVVGAPNDGTNGNDSGAIYIFAQ